MVDKRRKSRVADDFQETVKMSKRHRLKVVKEKTSLCSKQYCSMLWCIFCLSVFVIFIMSTPFTIPRRKWIDTCEYDFYKHLKIELSISKDTLNRDFRRQINRLYSIHHFTDAKHAELLKTIRKEKLLMKDLRRLHRTDPSVEVGRLALFAIHEYSAARSIAAITIKIEELILN